MLSLPQPLLHAPTPTMNTQSQGWLAISTEGFAAMNAARPPEHLVKELVQNALHGSRRVPGVPDLHVARLQLFGAFGTAGGRAVGTIDVLSQNSALSSIAVIDGALNKVSMQRANLGALQNRIEATVTNLSNVVTNTQASRSRIMDADYATETTNLARSQIIQQAATAMLAQANQSAQTVLTLLK